MTPEQLTALQSLAGRTLTQAEVDALTPPVGVRNDAGIAAVLSVGRTRLQATEIGTGTILALFEGLGGQFIDTLRTIGQTNRDVHWLVEGTLLRGKFDAGDPASRFGIQDMIANPAMAPFVPGMNALLARGIGPNPVSTPEVSNALNALGG